MSESVRIRRGRPRARPASHYVRRPNAKRVAVSGAGLEAASLRAAIEGAGYEAEEVAA